MNGSHPYGGLCPTAKSVGALVDAIQDMTRSVYRLAERPVPRLELKRPDRSETVNSGVEHLITAVTEASQALKELAKDPPWEPRRRDHP